MRERERERERNEMDRRLRGETESEWAAKQTRASERERQQDTEHMRACAWVLTSVSADAFWRACMY